mmetsp:Transcript_55363/g.121511  ORF Transcript_55363/g.121511 Transcript_55363/m.121511 type:complete len:218 (-) Transcript_55363:695-1348(-)
MDSQCTSGKSTLLSLASCGRCVGSPRCRQKGRYLCRGHAQQASRSKRCGTRPWRTAAKPRTEPLGLHALRRAAPHPPRRSLAVAMVQRPFAKTPHLSMERPSPHHSPMTPAAPPPVATRHSPQHRRCHTLCQRRTQIQAQKPESSALPYGGVCATFADVIFPPAPCWPSHGASPPSAASLRGSAPARASAGPGCAPAADGPAVGTASLPTLCWDSSC